MRLPPSFYFVNVEGHRRPRGRDAAGARADRGRARRRFQRVAASRFVDPFTGRPFPGNVIPASRISAAGAPRRGALSAAQPRRRRRPTSSRRRSASATRGPVRRSRPIITAGATARSTLRYSFSRDDRDLPFPAHGRNLPGLRRLRARSGAQLRRRALAGARRRAMFNELRVGVNALRRENLPQSVRHRRVRRARHHAARRSTPSTSAIPTLVVPGFETLGDDPNLPVVRRTRTLHLSDSLSHRSRPPSRQARRRAARTTSPTATTTCSRAAQATFTGAFTGHPVADLLLGLPTYHAARAPTTTARRCAPGRPTCFAQDDWRVTPRLTRQRRRALRVQRAAVRRRRSHGASSTSTTLQLQQVGQDGVSRSGLHGDLNNIAPRVGVSWDLTGSGTLAAARRLRHLLRQRHADRELGALLQPAVLRAAAVLPERAQPIFLDDPFPAGRRLRADADGQHARPELPHGATRSRRSLGLERVVRRHDAHRALRRRRTAATCVRKRNINQPRPGPGDIDPRRPIAGLRRHPARRVAGDVELSRPAAERRAAVTRAACRSAAPTRWSKSMDDTSAFLATDGDDNTPQNSRDLAAEWGPSDFDVRHRLVAVGDAGTCPRERRARRSLRDWQVSARLHRAVGPSVHAARQLRQQQHRQHRRRHVRLRSARTSSPARAPPGADRSATAARRSRSRRRSRSATPAATA